MRDSDTRFYRIHSQSVPVESIVHVCFFLSDSFSDAETIFVLLFRMIFLGFWFISSPFQLILQEVFVLHDCNMVQMRNPR